MSSTSTHFRPSPDALATRVGDEIVLVDLKTDRIYSLNRTAARIWELLCDDCDRAELERCMLEEFDVAPGEVAQAIDELVASLTEGGLLVRSA
ncbi:MAG TPA: PqqD family protein [Methylomirabilota bacterium]|nr:PqqD family protein [Methylomirabilota bacterium]